MKTINLSYPGSGCEGSVGAWHGGGGRLHPSKKKMIPHALFQFSLVGSRSAQGQRNTVGLEGGQWKHIIIVDDQSYYREK